jgi:hypothetical protein
MSDIKQAIPYLTEPTKSIMETLIEFYETMKELEKDEEKGGKQATKIIMTTDDILKIFFKNNPLQQPIFLNSNKN